MTKDERELIIELGECLTDITRMLANIKTALNEIEEQINLSPDRLAQAIEFRFRKLAEEEVNGDDEEYDDEDNKEKKNGWDL